jgi:WD40 repeat protein
VRTWDEHDRSEDLLWTGSAYREYAVWRERYPGGLTDTEEAFGSAMKSLATRRRRRRRLAVAAGFAILLAGFTIVASFWQRSVRETRRAEAAELVALGQLELEGYPTASVAYAMTSLELADSRGARMLAIEALWRGPTAFIANETPTVTIAFTPDGRWLTQSYAVAGDGPVGLIGADGTTAFLEGTEGHEYIYPPPHGEESDLFAMQDWGKNQSGENVTKRIVLFSASEGRIIAEAPYDQRVFDVAMIPEDRRLLMMIPAGKGRLSIDSLGFDGQHTRLGTREFDLETDRSYWHKLDTHNGRIVATKTGHDIFVTDIGQSGLSQPRLLGREKEAIGRLAVDPKGRFVASATVGGDIRLWPLKERLPTDSVPGPPNGALQFTADGNFLCSKWWGSVDGIQTGDDCQFWIWAVDSDGLTFLRRTDVGRPAPLSNLVPDNDGGRFVRTGAGLAIRLWRRSAPADAEPLELLRGQVGQVFMPAFHPEGRWLAVADNSGLGLWPLARPYPIVIRRHTDTLLDILFAPDGSWLASAPGAGDGMVMLWPLGGIAPSSGRAVFDPSEFAYITALATNSDGSKILVTGGPRLGVHFVSLDDESTDILPLSESCSQYFDVAISHDGRMAAATCGVWDHESRKIDIWDLTRREHVAELAKGESVYSAGPVFVGIGQLLALDVSGLRRWDLDTGSSSLIHEGTFQKFVASKSARRVLLLDAPSENDPGRAVFVDLDTGVSTVLETHGGQIRSLALDAEGTVAVTGDLDGTVRIGYVTGEEPRVLLGQKQAVEALDIDPLGRWVASGGKDTTIRLWPMPDLSKPPLHTLPREELIAKLKTLTNLRVVRDEDSATGWKLTHDPFPGWETVPTW